MTTEKPLVIVSRRLPEAVEARMRELFDVELNENDVPFTNEKIIDALKRADVFVPTVTDHLDRDLLQHSGEQLRLIANFGTGVDNICLETTEELGIKVTNTPGVLTEDTADMTMALILAVPRRMVEGSIFLKEKANEWQGWSPTWMLGHRINGKNLGIIGFGRIGQAVAKRAKAFGLKVHYYDIRRAVHEVEEELGATYYESLDQMLARMDILSIHCPHTPATYHLLSARRLNLLKPQAYIVNTARGEVIDEDALSDLIDEGKISGAGLDVFEHEPSVNPKLLACENVVVLPHMGSATIEGRLNMGDRVIINIKSFIDGHTPPNLINSNFI